MPTAQSERVESHRAFLWSSFLGCSLFGQTFLHFRLDAFQHKLAQSPVTDLAVDVLVKDRQTGPGWWVSVVSPAWGVPIWNENGLGRTKSVGTILQDHWHLPVMGQKLFSVLFVEESNKTNAFSSVLIADVLPD